MSSRSVHTRPSERVDETSLCSSVGYRALEEQSLEEAIRRCYNEFALKLIDEIRVVVRKREIQALTLQRESDISRAGDRASPGQLLGDPAKSSSKDPNIDDADGDDDSEGDDSVDKGDDSRDACVSGTARLQDSAKYEKMVNHNVPFEMQSSSDAAEKKPRLQGLAIADRWSQVRRFSENSEVSNVLRGARLNILARTTRVSDQRSTIIDKEMLNFIMGVVVIFNMVQLGISADCARDWLGWRVVDCVFAGAFVIEFMMRLAMRGIYNHFVVYWKATLFDALIVLPALVELVCDFFIGLNLGTGAESFTVLRVVRLLRLVRFVKTFHLPMFSDFQLMCEGLITGSQTLTWSIILLMVPIYSAALLLRETIGEDATNKDLVKPFTSLPWAFFTTFRCVMGDCSTPTGGPLAELLIHKVKFGWLFAIFYVLMILIIFLGVFNVIIAIYVEQIVTSAKQNETLQKLRKIKDARKMELLFASLIQVFVKNNEGDIQATATLQSEKPSFHALDADAAASIEITKVSFDRVMESGEVQSILEQLAIPSEDRWDLFDILDSDASGSLKLREIVSGLKKLRGEPRRSDVVANGLIIRDLQKRVHRETESIFNMARRTAISVDHIRQDQSEHKDMILDKLGDLVDLIGDVAIGDVAKDRLSSYSVAQRRPGSVLLV